MYYISENAHSINIGGYNTWKSWHIIPTSKPSVNPPDVKENFVEIPGMPGALDYTEILSKRPVFGVRKGSWEFYVLTEYDGVQENSDWADTYSTIMDDIHGKRFKIILEDDPMYYYEGRVKVSDYKSDKERSTITIDYTIDPYKNPVVTTDGDEWQWDQLFGLKQILYGEFTVTGYKMRTIINSDYEPIKIYTDSTAQMIASVFEDQNGDKVKENIIIPAGITEEESRLIVQPGNTKIKFQGTGKIKLYYEKGRRL